MRDSLFEIFDKHTGRPVYKWEHYFDIYERHFEKFRNSTEEIVIVEIGVLYGGSLQLWKKYFGKNVKIFGIDVYEDCKKYEEENITVFVGSQADTNFLNHVKNTIPKIDILIDDGSHRMNHQIVAFKNLFDHIQDGGIYIVEDTHTSYWVEYGGGKRRSGTFINFAQRLIDNLHGWYSTQMGFNIDYYTTNIGGIHFYDSIVVFDKKSRNIKSDVLKRGVEIEPDRESKYKNQKKTWLYKFAYFILIEFNKLLRF